MPFTSLRFLALVALSIVLYYVIPRRRRWIVLLLASYVFYIVGGWRTVFYLLFTTGVTYGTGRVLGILNSRLKEIPKERADAINRLKKLKKCTAAFGLVLAFGVLFLLRYWNFAMELLTDSDRFSLNLLIPLGVSFFTFQSVGYVIDVYRGKHSPERNVFKFALFVSFFPQIIQGPISRYHQLSHQLTEAVDLDFDNIKYGIQLAMWGLFKKLVIADRAAVAVDTIFANSGYYNGSVIAFAMFFYSIQLYCDFSGGIDITRGIAKMFGIELVENFRRPIFASSLADFWRRWHITLGAWMKDYLFFSMALSKPIVRIGKFTRSKIGGTLGKIIPTSICTFAVYFVIGIWHGANFRFIAFGFWNGAIITSSLLLESAYSSIKSRVGINDKSGYWRVFCVLRTSLIVFVGRYMTRAPRFLTAMSMLRRTFTDFSPRTFFDGTILTLGLTRFDIWIVLICVVAVVVLEFFQERGMQLRKSLEERGFFAQWAAILIPMAVTLFLGVFGPYTTQFIYGQF
ncbi:MAG: MBOAT family protein [Oscillospiraceae bacterium]|nr:MBOAT family protein [Oscillospiraceae bacterium]